MTDKPSTTDASAQSPEWLDVSVPLRAGMPTWPGSVGISVTQVMSLAAGEEADVSTLSCDVHTGTHVDAPSHFIQGGATIDTLPLSELIGEAWVAFVPDARAISAADLDALHVPAGTRRLLLKTRNSELWRRGVDTFDPDFAALTAEAAEWVVARGIRLIGVDYLSVQRFGDSPRTHTVLLESRVIIVEGLQLAAIEPGPYEMVCLPLKLQGAEGAPARCVLRQAPGVPAP